MSITNGQIKQFHTLLSKLNLQEDQKRDLIYKATSGRGDHTRDMTFEEAKDLIQYLNIQANEAGNRMRKKILHYCHLMQWYISGTNKLDFARIDRFCIKSGFKHKEFNKYSPKELPTLITQFEEVYKHYIKSL